MAVSIFIDTDNGMGSPRGDIDDGFAVAALLMQRDYPISCLSSVGGNTSSHQAHANNQVLGELLGYTGPYALGSDPGMREPTESSNLLVNCSHTRIAALGPLTNIAQAIADGWNADHAELIGIGTNYRSKGRFPPIWPYEFNFSKDKDAFRRVYDSAIKITLAPLDVAVKLQISEMQVKELPAPYNSFFYSHSRRWYLRARWLKWKSTVPLWDLVAAIYLLKPELFKSKKYLTTLHRNGWLDYGRGNREVNLIQDFDPGEVWKYLVTLFPSTG